MAKRKSKRKTIDTLIQDIYELFDKGADLSETGLEVFTDSIKQMFRDRFASYKEERKQTLRMSNIGKNPLQLWYDINGTEKPPPASASDKFKFLFGDIIEALVLFLASEAGHEVTRQQEEVELEGIKGHLDAFIDGELVDVKSTSKFAFKKFQSESALRADDSFGYVEQLSGYANATGKDQGYFLAVGKEDGQLQLLRLEADDVRPRIKSLKDILQHTEPPFDCHNDRPIGTSGNRQLSYPCTYCNHKEKCWEKANNGEGLRIFDYASGPAYLTNVAVTPNVPEITQKKVNKHNVG
jgi:hypothetical protein